VTWTNTGRGSGTPVRPCSFRRAHSLTSPTRQIDITEYEAEVPSFGSLEDAPIDPVVTASGPLPVRQPMSACRVEPLPHVRSTEE
jgi:hypothetical protein